jgi:hypothetical protein
MGGIFERVIWFFFPEDIAFHAGLVEKAGNFCKKIQIFEDERKKKKKRKERAQHFCSNSPTANIGGEGWVWGRAHGKGIFQGKNFGPPCDFVFLFISFFYFTLVWKRDNAPMSHIFAIIKRKKNNSRAVPTKKSAQNGQKSYPLSQPQLG